MPARDDDCCAPLANTSAPNPSPAPGKLTRYVVKVSMRTAEHGAARGEYPFDADDFEEARQLARTAFKAQVADVAPPDFVVPPDALIFDELVSQGHTGACPLFSWGDGDPGHPTDDHPGTDLSDASL